MASLYFDRILFSDVFLSREHENIFLLMFSVEKNANYFQVANMINKGYFFTKINKVIFLLKNGSKNKTKPMAIE